MQNKKRGRKVSSDSLAVSTLPVDLIGRFHRLIL